MARKYPEGYYVYLHRRKSDGQVFYVGKGKGVRAWHKGARTRSEWWHRVVDNHGYFIEIVCDGLSEQEAFDLEVKEIKKYRNLECPLVNLTDGGEGASGHVPVRGMRVYSSLGDNFTSCYAAAKWLRSNGFEKASHAAIQRCAKGRRHTCYDRAWSYEGYPGHPSKVGIENRGSGPIKYQSKPVVNSDGMEFYSLNEAVRWLRDNGKPKAFKKSISMCCNGKHKKAYGYGWKYAEDKST